MKRDRNGLLPIAQQVGYITAISEKLQAEVTSILFSPILFTNATARFLVAKSKALGLVEKHNRAARIWVNEYITEAYNDGSDHATGWLRKINKKSSGKNQNQVNRQSKIKAILGMMESINSARDSIKQKINQYFSSLEVAKKAVQIQNFSNDPEIEKGIKKIIKKSIIPAWRFTKMGHAYMATRTRVEASKELRELYEKVFGDFDFIKLLCKDGKTRNYRPGPYFERLARTEIRKAQTQAVKDRCAEYNNDLVMVSNHSTACGLCVPFEGQVYSLSGTSTIYPPADDEPPFHPNCAHVWIPISTEYIDILKEKGEWNLDEAA